MLMPHGNALWGNGGFVQAVLCPPDVVAFCWSRGKKQEESSSLYSLRYEQLSLTRLGVHSPLFPSNELGFVLPYHVWMHIVGN